MKLSREEQRTAEWINIDINLDHAKSRERERNLLTGLKFRSLSHFAENAIVFVLKWKLPTEFISHLFHHLSPRLVGSAGFSVMTSLKNASYYLYYYLSYWC